MQVVAIEKLTKTKFRVLWDDDTAWTLKVQAMNELSLTEGLEANDETFEYWYEDYVIKPAKRKALSLLEKSDYTKKDLENRLFRDGFPADAVKRAVDYVVGYRYVDDERYARNYINYRTQGKSRQMVYQTLVSKGIDSDIIEATMSEGEFDDVENIQQICEKKFGDIGTLPKEKQIKVLNYFLRRGYKYSDIVRVIKDFDSI